VEGVGSTFFILVQIFFKSQSQFLSYFSLRDINLLKVSVVSSCEIAGDVMFFKLPTFIIKRRLFLFVPRNIALRELQVTRFKNTDVRSREEF
jgi:hypothetical protein